MGDRTTRVAEYAAGTAPRVTVDVVVGDAAHGAVSVSMDRGRLYSGAPRRGIPLGSAEEIEGQVLQVVVVASKVVPQATRVSATVTLNGGTRPLELVLATAVDSSKDVELVARVMFV